MADGADSHETQAPLSDQTAEFTGRYIVSVSLGADVRQVSQAYETVGRRALEAGTLIVAAAGNNARRSAGDPGFVGIPPNSPLIMAVAAVDPNSASPTSRPAAASCGEAGRHRRARRGGLLVLADARAV